MKVRLRNDEIENIKRIIKNFDPDAAIYLFGSRIHEEKRGGDIDLLVISKTIDYSQKIKILTQLFLTFGDRRIDLIITENPLAKPFTKMAYEEGVRL